MAGQVTSFLFDASVDSAFSGGSLAVKTRASGVCGQSPSADNGTAARFPNGNAVSFGGQFDGRLTLRAGPNIICAWLVDSAGNVLTSKVWTVIARPATDTSGASAALLRGWNPQTVACRSLTKSEAGQALAEPASTIFVNGGAFTGLTAFEQQHSASCVWEYPPSRYLDVILVPEQTPPTLAYAHKLYEQAGAMSKTPGPCAPVSGIGAAACVFRGGDGVPGWGTILAVQGHLIVELDFHLVYPHFPSDTSARVHAREELLARKGAGTGRPRPPLGTMSQRSVARSEERHALTEPGRTGAMTRGRP
jgi:hypothetical protein